MATQHEGLYCDAILEEYARVLLERRHPPERARRLIAYIQSAFAPVEITSSVAPTAPNDPDDDIFVICALDGDADYLVSGDTHLLALRPHYQRPTFATFRMRLLRWRSEGDGRRTRHARVLGLWAPSAQDPARR